MTNTTRIRYGQIETITIDGSSSVTQSDTIYNYETTTKLTSYTSGIFVDSDKQVLAEVLKLMDKIKDEDVVSIAFDCTKKPKSEKPFQMKVCWTVK